LEERGGFFAELRERARDFIFDEKEDFSFVFTVSGVEELVPDGIARREGIAREADAVREVEGDVVILVRHAAL